MPVTIKDVAKSAQVSIATVSRVINNKGYISQKTRKKVYQAMNQLHYTPNIAARKLQSKHTATIGVILPSLDNPLYSELFENVEKYLAVANYQTLLCSSNNQPEREQKYFSLLQANQVEGIITSSHSKFFIQQDLNNYPIICFDRSISKNIPSVRSNNYLGGQKIAKVIIHKNKKNILILSGSKEDLNPINDRIKGMLSIFQNVDTNVQTIALDFDSSLLVKKLLIQKILSTHHFDAICCTDDLTALLVLSFTKSQNHPPLITGYDGSTFVQTLFPDLLTVKQPIGPMAELMCDLLLAKIQNPQQNFETEYVFPISLTQQN